MLLRHLVCLFALWPAGASAADWSLSLSGGTATIAGESGQPFVSASLYRYLGRFYVRAGAAWFDDGSVTEVTSQDVTPPTAIMDLPPPKNVVLILSDDQRAELMPYMPLTSSLLNAETVRFSRAFVTTSWCCPSRSSILTGLYAHNHGVLTNTAPTGGATKFKPGSTVATWLHQVGYRTGLFGKYLNEYPKISPAIPPGWDDFQVFSSPPDYFNYAVNENGTIVNYGSATSAYATDVFAEKARQFIWNTPTQQPLFLFFAPYVPHGPATPYPSDVGAYATVPKWRPPSFNEPDVTDKPAWIRALKKITDAQMVTMDALHQRQLETLLSLDRAVASIVTALQLNGRWGSTLVIFASDNGYAWGEHRLVDRKNCPYEECIRVPYWVRAPGLIARTDTNLVANIDLAPTIAAWAGVTPPGKVNGMNLRPLLENRFTPWRRALLIEHWGGAPTSSGVRTSRYLYNEYANGNKEFYDLVLDPYQRFSRHKVEANAPLIASLKAILTEIKAQ